MKKFALIAWLVLMVALTVPPLSLAHDVLTRERESVYEPGSLDRVQMAAAFIKKESPEVKGSKGFAKHEGLATRTRTEAMALGKRIQVDISKMEAELSRLSGAPAARAPSSRKGLPAVQGAAPTANMKGPSQSLLRQAGNLTRLYQKEGLQEGKERHSGPMETAARKLSQLANKYPEAVKANRGQNIIKEMSAVLARLKSQANAHQGWVQGLAAAPAGAAPLSKPVPANIKVAPGAGRASKGVVFPKVEGNTGETSFDGVDGESLPAVQGEVLNKVEPKSREAGFDGVDGESLPGATQLPTGGVVYPKVEILGGETGYEGVDGESLGQ